MSIYKQFQDAASANLGKTAVFFGEKTLNYKELLSNTRRLAFSLKARGLTKGRHAAILLSNSIEFIETYLAIYAVAFAPPYFTMMAQQYLMKRPQGLLGSDLSGSGRKDARSQRT